MQRASIGSPADVKRRRFEDADEEEATESCPETQAKVDELSAILSKVLTSSPPSLPNSFSLHSLPLHSSILLHYPVLSPHFHPVFCLLSPRYTAHAPSPQP